MILTIGAALITLLALLLLLRPLVSSRPPDLASGDDREVYAAQLKEIEADKARGLIREADADAARTEIARRLLRAGGPLGAGTEGRRARLAGLFAVICFVPAFSVGAYLFLGTPEYGDQPLAARLQPVTDEDIPRLLAEAEERLAENPEDARGWLAVAPIYSRLRRFEDAANAYNRVNALVADNAEFLAAEGESLAFANEGTVTSEARALFERSLALSPQAVRPAIFLAIAERQAGNTMAAAERWRTLLARSNGTEPWLQIATAEFSRMGMVPNGGDAAPGAGDPGQSDGAANMSADAAPLGPGPTLPQGPGADAPDAPGAAAPPPGLRAPQPDAPGAPPGGAVAGLAQNPPPQVQAMVERLATRLASEGGSADEWARLVRSYTVLGREDDAREATVSALAALTGDAREAFRSAPDVQ
ncbi:MAG: c-type cytochrome biogenesis protein CcmI, partial [Pseudomonadota bacterium]